VRLSETDALLDMLVTSQNETKMDGQRASQSFRKCPAVFGVTMHDTADQGIGTWPFSRN
jgi:hypothetical protein